MGRNDGRVFNFRVVLMGASVVSFLFLSGCAAPGFTAPWGANGSMNGAPVFLVDAQFQRTANHTGPEPMLVAGGRCADVKLKDDHVALQKGTLGDLDPGDPLVILNPTVGEGWDVVSAEPSHHAAPARLDVVVEVRARTLADIDHNVTNNMTYVDDTAVTLPHQWSLTDAYEGWRVDLTLTRGPDQWTTFTRLMC